MTFLNLGPSNPAVYDLFVKIHRNKETKCQLFRCFLKSKVGWPLRNVYVNCQNRYALAIRIVSTILGGSQNDFSQFRPVKSSSLRFFLRKYAEINRYGILNFSWKIHKSPDLGDLN